MIALYALIGFLSGSLMFAYWLGLAAHVDIRAVGDGNPGAFNLWHAAGYRLGLFAIFLEFMKGYLPLLILIHGDYISDWNVAPVAIAPVLGHAFSPFLGFKGGKTIAVSFGVWSAVTQFEASVAYAVILALTSLAARLALRGKPTSSDTDGCMAVAGMCMLGGYLAFRAFPGSVVALWLCNLTVLTYANRWKLYRSLKSFYEGYKRRYI